MADEGAGIGEGETLKAPVADQLREKAQREAELEEERRAAEERGATLERHKEAERAEVARHGADPATWPERKRAARHAPGRRGWSLGRLALLAVAIAVVTRLTRRR